MTRSRSNRYTFYCFLSVIAFLLSILGSPLFLSGQIVFSGDFDGKLEYLNLRRTLPDSLRNKTIGFLGSGELDLEINRRRWNAFISLFGTYTRETDLYTKNVPAAYSLNFYQAWFRYFLTQNFSLQAGRIEIEYDDERFFQARDWGNLVTTHNAIIAHYLVPDTGTMADLGFAVNNFNRQFSLFGTDPSVNNYRYMGYVYFYKRLFENQLKLTFTDIFDANDNGISHSVLYGRSTLGLSSWLSLSDWDINLAGFYQFGHIPDGRMLTSGYYALYVSYQPFDWLNIMPAFEHLSGDDLSDSLAWRNHVHGFSLLYGNVTRSFGKSGIFNYSLRSNLHPGLNNLYLQLTFDFSDKISLEANYHWFSIPHPYVREYVPDSNRFMIVRVNPSFLHQAELTLTYTPIPSLEITLDYSLLFPGEGMKNYNGWNFTSGSPVSFSYLEIEWTPVFYPSGKKKKIID